ncbi:hypothetical protein [Aneurinibacillus tyrosinisolvens]|uniref:hypothetical protein n=1 Tax=Aneurinibacillus tyrosinisolvens TaxID=1443435 RepID=UPI00063F8D00|nr:hypothetical protein [Aneurinibacillus tyrosinisolvens]
MMAMLKIGVFLVSVLSLAVFGWGTYNQIKGQAETNKEMKKVAQNIKKADALTSITVQSLQPLEETAKTIQTMNGGLTTTARLLTEMNIGLGSVTKGEQVIIQNLTALNGTTNGVLSQLQAVSTGSGKLVGSTGKMQGQVQSESASMQGLNGLTDESIAEMRKLNKKFSLLRSLP